MLIAIKFLFKPFNLKKMHKKVLLIAILGLIFRITIAQVKGDFIVIKANEIVGDTVDVIEKIKYNLYPQIPHLNFNYAQYLMKGDQIILRITRKDSTFYDQPYTLELLYQDGNKITNNRSKVIEGPKINYKNVLIQIADINTNKSIKLKKGELIQLKLKDKKESINLAKIKRIDIVNEPILCVKYEGKEVMLPLSQIDYIYRMPKYLHVLIKTDAVLFSMVGFISIFASKNNIVLAAPFITCGATGFFIKNRKFYIDNSNVDLIYK